MFDLRGVPVGKIAVSNLVLESTRIMVQADADDTQTVAGADSIMAVDPRIKVDIRDREDTIAAKWNRALSEPADVYLIDADDAPFATPGYDSKILEAAKRFPDGIGMVYGHMANLSFSGVLAPTAKFCEKLGHIFPEFFPYWFVDHWIDDVCRHIGRMSFADVRTDQTNVGTTQEFREPGWWATWFDANYLRRRKIAEKVMLDSDFASPEWLKDILLTSFEISRIDSWARHVPNDSVRKQMGSAPGPKPAPRPGGKK